MVSMRFITLVADVGEADTRVRDGEDSAAGVVAVLEVTSVEDEAVAVASSAVSSVVVEADSVVLLAAVNLPPPQLHKAFNVPILRWPEPLSCHQKASGALVQPHLFTA
jgi:hypothetical protein